MKIAKIFLVMGVILIVGSVSAWAGGYYFQDFEVNTKGWDVYGGSKNASRVPTGTHGITSFAGNWNAEVHDGATNWGENRNVFYPSEGYYTQTSIYLDMDTAYNDTRFDYSSAVNDNTGSFLRGFIFNAGFYNDEGLGDRFVISASLAAGRMDSDPKNPVKDPITIATTGWYIFNHKFYDDGSDVLAVDLSISDAADNLVKTWSLSDPSDIISTDVGGSRYGWFVNNEFDYLSIDNTSHVVPEPPVLLLFCIPFLGLISWKLLRRSFVLS